MTKLNLVELEKNVQKATGLNWQLIEALEEQDYISWMLLLPLDGQKVKVTGQSSISQNPELLHYVNLECQPALMLEILRRAAK